MSETNERFDPRQTGPGTPEQDGAQQVVVVGPDGRPVGAFPVPPRGDDEVPGEDTVADLINQPAKVMRIGSMIKQLLEEVRGAPLDEAGRKRLAEIHDRSIKELEAGLAPELIEELERISLPFSEDSVPSEAELRIAQAQLVGWLEGLFHGIQTALFAQQMAARAQLDEMRRHAAIEAPPAPDQNGPRQSGPYL